MNNLHRELAPISDAAWAQIEEEASRTLKRYLAARRVVDVEGPQGATLSAVGTGHLRKIDAPAEGILARQRIAKPVVELRVPFELDRQQIDDVERGANDSDWQPVKDAARRIAFAEDRAVFEGYKAGGGAGRTIPTVRWVAVTMQPHAFRSAVVCCAGLLRSSKLASRFRSSPCWRRSRLRTSESKGH
jgi:uncharacterized linocin/CFP29 family protein